MQSRTKKVIKIVLLISVLVAAAVLVYFVTNKNLSDNAVSLDPTEKVQADTPPPPRPAPRGGGDP